MICLPLLALSVTVAQASQWEDPTTGINWHYNEYGNWCEIFDCDHCYGSLEIPSEIAGLEVRSIKGESFIGCSAITSVTLPESLRTINGGVFAKCNGLQTIEIPKNVNFVGRGALSGCASLMSVTVQEGNGSFVSVNNCLLSADGKKLHIIPCGLKYVDIPSTVVTLCGTLLNDTKNLTELTIPSSVRQIEDCAFEGSGLMRLIFEGNAPSVGVRVLNETSDDLVVSVPAGSSGWPSDGLWCGKRLEYRNSIVHTVSTNEFEMAYGGVEVRIYERDTEISRTKKTVDDADVRVDYENWIERTTAYYFDEFGTLTNECWYMDSTGTTERVYRDASNVGHINSYEEHWSINGSGMTKSEEIHSDGSLTNLTESLELDMEGRATRTEGRATQVYLSDRSSDTESSFVSVGESETRYSYSGYDDTSDLIAVWSTSSSNYSYSAGGYPNESLGLSDSQTIVKEVYCDGTVWSISRTEHTERRDRWDPTYYSEDYSYSQIEDVNREGLTGRTGLEDHRVYFETDTGSFYALTNKNTYLSNLPDSNGRELVAITTADNNSYNSYLYDRDPNHTQPETFLMAGESAVVDAVDQEDALRKVCVSYDTDLAQLADYNHYPYFFRLKAEALEDGKWKVTSEIDPEAIHFEATENAFAGALGSIAAGTEDSVLIPSSPGLYYSLLYTDNLIEPMVEGERVLAEGGLVDVPLPPHSSSGYFRIKVSSAAK